MYRALNFSPYFAARIIFLLNRLKIYKKTAKSELEQLAELKAKLLAIIDEYKTVSNVLLRFNVENAPTIRIFHFG